MSLSETAIRLTTVSLALMLLLSAGAGVGLAQDGSNEPTETDAAENNPDNFVESAELLEDRLKQLGIAILSIVAIVGGVLWGTGISTKYTQTGMRMVIGCLAAILLILGIDSLVGYLENIAPSVLLPMAVKSQFRSEANPPPETEQE